MAQKKRPLSSQLSLDYSPHRSPGEGARGGEIGPPRVIELAHEIGVHLAPIRSSADILRSRPELKDKEARALLGAISEEATFLARVARRMLRQPSMGEDGAGSGSLREIIERCTALFSAEARVKGLRVTLRSPKRFPPVRLNHDDIWRVLGNLLSNAVKFTESGSVAVSARVEGPFVVITVSDTGRGISREELEAALTMSASSGSGLNLCQEILESGGARFEVDTEPGRGSSFRLFLPVLERQGEGEPALDEERLNLWRDEQGSSAGHIQREVAFLSELATTISDAPDLDHIYDAVMRMTAERMPRRRLCLFLKDLTEGTYHQRWPVSGKRAEPVPVQEELIPVEKGPSRCDRWLHQARRMRMPGTVPPFFLIPFRDRARCLGFLTISGSQPLSPRETMITSMLTSQVTCRLADKMAYRDLESLFLGTLAALVSTVDAKNSYAMGHSLRVAELSEGISRCLNLSEEERRAVKVSGLLHDVGKVLLPDWVVAKEGRFTPDDYELMKTHPSHGGRVLSGFPQLSQVMEGVEYHHERMGGHGYPRGLLGQQIPLVGRIVAVADAYDAMTNDRSYRKAFTSRAALATLSQGRGVEYDPLVVEALVRLRRRKAPGHADQGQRV